MSRSRWGRSAADRRDNPLLYSLYSFRRADATLGARNGTIAALVAAGRLRAVPWGRRRRVLAADVERIAAEGLTVDGRRPPSPRRKTDPGVGDRIRDIDVPRGAP